MKLDALKAEAHAQAERQGHRLGSFYQDPGFPGVVFYSNCESTACGYGAVIDLAPKLPSLAIAGDAISLLCPGLVEEARQAVAPPPPNTQRTIRVEAAGEVCRFCKADTKLDAAGFCSDACWVEFRVRASPSFARDQVYNRDLGVCARCGLDTDRVWKDLISLSFNDADRYNALWAEMLARGFPEHRLEAMSLWDANHKLPVVEGGGACGLDGLETLCVPCHRSATGALMERLDGRKAREKAAVETWLDARLGKAPIR